jgi:hypothetical protein
MTRLESRLGLSSEAAGLATTVTALLSLALLTALGAEEELVEQPEEEQVCVQFI